MFKCIVFTIVAIQISTGESKKAQRLANLQVRKDAFALDLRSEISDFRSDQIKTTLPNCELSSTLLLVLKSCNLPAILECVV